MANGLAIYSETSLNSSVSSRSFLVDLLRCFTVNTASFTSSLPVSVPSSSLASLIVLAGITSAGLKRGDESRPVCLPNLSPGEGLVAADVSVGAHYKLRRLSSLASLLRFEAWMSLAMQGDCVFIINLHNKYFICIY